MVELKHSEGTIGTVPGYSAAERLYRDATERLEKNFFNTMNDGYDRVANRPSTAGGYNPHISAQSKMISEHSTMFNGNLKDFHSRQTAFLEKQKENREIIDAEHGDKSKCTFKPQINLTSEIICESDPHRIQTDQVERLYAQDRKKKEVVREMKEQEMYAQYTFQP